MNILTAVTKDIKKLKDEYLSALEEIYGENDTVIADISDENTAVAREMIIETGKYDITVYSTGGYDSKFEYDDEHESLEWLRGTASDWFCEKKVQLIDDADMGLFVWDGWDIDICTDILSLIMKGKPSRVICTSAEKIVDVKNMDELREISGSRFKKRYVCMNEFLKEDDYREVIDTFIPSKEMAAFLKEHPLPKHRVIDIIINAPVSIEKKAIFCKALSETDNVRYELFETVEKMIDQGDCEGYLSAYQLYKTIEVNTFSYHWEETDKAIRGLDTMKPSDVLLVCCAEFSNYNTVSIPGVKRSKEVPVRSRKKVGSYIYLDEYYVERWAFGFNTYWYEAVKWDEKASEELEKSYRYTFVIGDRKKADEYVLNGEARVPSTVMFFDKCVYKRDMDVSYEANEIKEPVVYVKGRRMLPLPIPFEAGDILKIDCLPFMDIAWVVLLEVNNDDTCGAQILYCDEDRLWQRGVLDRDFGHGIYRPRLSCFYRLEKYQDSVVREELSTYKRPRKGRCIHNEKILRKVSDYICHDKEKGSRLAQDLFELKKGGITDDELLDMIGGK